MGLSPGRARRGRSSLSTCDERHRTQTGVGMAVFGHDDQQLEVIRRGTVVQEVG